MFVRKLWFPLLSLSLILCEFASYQLKLSPTTDKILKEYKELFFTCYSFASPLHFMHSSHSLSSLEILVPYSFLCNLKANWSSILCMLVSSTEVDFITNVSCFNLTICGLNFSFAIPTVSRSTDISDLENWLSCQTANCSWYVNHTPSFQRRTSDRPRVGVFTFLQLNQHLLDWELELKAVFQKEMRTVAVSSASWKVINLRVRKSFGPLLYSLEATVSLWLDD